MVLAAGTGSRFAGENKLLAEVEGSPLVRHATETLLEASLDAVGVVVGHDAEAVERALADLDVAVIPNPDYDAGQASSVVAGIEWARAHAASVAVIALGDMPRVSPATVDRLLDVAGRVTADAVVPTYEGQRGNPVAVRASAFDALCGLVGDAGARQLFDDLALRRVAVDDPGVHADVDTRDALTDVTEWS